jgi:hypothetical protein
MSIYTLFGSGEFNDRIHIEDLFLDQPLDTDRPRPGSEILSQPCGPVLVGRKLKVVVVVGDIAIRRNGLIGAELTLLDAVYLRVGLSDNGRGAPLVQSYARSRCCSGQSGADQEIAAVQGKHS